MKVTRAQIIILLSMIIIGVGVYLTNKAKGQVDGGQNEKWGKILVWSGIAILLVTSAMAYRIVPRA